MKNRQDQISKSINTEKTNQDFNNEMPDPKSPNFIEKNLAAAPENPSGVKNSICPMHLEVNSNFSGKCPKCGMGLIEKKYL